MKRSLVKKKGRIYLIVADLSNKCPVHKKNRLVPEKNSQVPKNTAMSHFSYKNTYCKAIFDQNEKKKPMLKTFIGLFLDGRTTRRK